MFGDGADGTIFGSFFGTLALPPLPAGGGGGASVAQAGEGRSKSRYRRLVLFDGTNDAAKLNTELQNLARAGYRSMIRFSKESALEPRHLNIMAQQVSRVTKAKLYVRFDGADTAAKLNKLFTEVERLLR